MILVLSSANVRTPACHYHTIHSLAEFSDIKISHQKFVFVLHHSICFVMFAFLVWRSLCDLAADRRTQQHHSDDRH